MEREDETELLTASTTKPTLADPTPNTSAAGSLEMNPVERFQKVNAEKDEGNFLFREKRYAEALERYHEALAHLKIYRHQWRMSRLRRTLTAHLVPLPPPCTSSSSHLSSSSSSAAEVGAMTSRCTTIAAISNSEAIRSGREDSKGKEKMPLDEDFSDEEEQRTATCNGDVKIELTDTRGNEKGKRRNDAEKGAMSESDTEDEQGCKRRRLNKEEADGELEADEMTVDIIDKTSYRLPKDMGCHQSSSTLPSQAIISAALPSLLPTSWKLLSTPPSVLKQKSRSFKEMTECEKNLLRLEIIIRLNIAACEIRLGQPDVAILHCRKVIRTNDLECCEPLLFAKALYRKAQCLKLQGRFREACHVLQLAATLSPTDRAIRNELTVLEEKQKKGSIVCKYFQKLRCSGQNIMQVQPATSPPPSLVNGHQEIEDSAEASSAQRVNRLRSALFGGSNPSRNLLALLCKREVSVRTITPRQKIDLAWRQLPPDVASGVDHYHRRAYASQWSADGEILFTTCQDWNIRLYSNEARQLKCTYVINAKKGQWTITDAAMSTDKTFIIYSSITPIVHLASLPMSVNEQLPFKSRHTPLNFVGAQGSDYSGIWCIALSTDNREVLAGTSDSSLCLYDLEKNQLVERVSAHEDDVNSICYVETYGAGSNGSLVASASDDGLIYIWDKRCMTHPVGTLFGHTEGLTSICSQGDGRYLLTNSKDQTLKLWDMRRMVSRCQAQPPQKRYIWDYRGMSYPGAPGVDRHPCDLSISTYIGHSVLRTLIRCRFTPPSWSGMRYACTASADGRVYIYDLQSTELVRVYNPCSDRNPQVGPPLSPPPSSSSGTVVRDFSWHPDIPALVTSAWNGRVCIFSHDTLGQDPSGVLSW